MKRDAVLDERVGADHQMRGAAGDPLQARPRCARGTSAVSSDARQTERLAERRDRREVLFGQELGRRHERRLVAVVDGRQRGEQRDDRLAAADVPLHEPMHRMRTRHVGEDLAHDALLRPGERERQPRAQRAA